MSEICTTGIWCPKTSREREFVAAWTTFAGWASGMPGAGTLRLTRDEGDAGRFVSLGVWTSNEAVRAWKGSPDFRHRIGRVLEHVDSVEPSELAVVATATSDSATIPT
jgi:heme-degrading monooxygenase HmoA